VRTLIDVRAFPVSRRHPQFSRAPLAATLADAGIDYEWQGKPLGGYRKAPYQESNPDDCHRRHIADWLAARGYRVVHLLAPGRAREHALNPQEELWRDV
jgi:uncharacterized protein (DUF488 family)